MKKILLTSALIASTLTSFAQSQIPNGDFENWSTFSGCSSLDSLNNFLTTDQSNYYNILADVDQTYCTPNPSAIKSTNKYAGTYALKMTPTPIPFTSNFSSNFVSLGRSIDQDVEFGMPFTDRPTKLVGYYKFTKAGTDNLSIYIGGYNNTIDEDIFGAELVVTASTPDYVRFELDLVYESTSQPTHLELVLGLANSTGTGSAGTDAYIDNLVLEYGTPTSTVNYQSSSSINVFAANETINFSDDVSEVRVVDMVGSEKIAHATKTHAVNTSALNTGLYIVTYKYKDAYFSKKVVIE